jgi:hypothetical protein
MGEPAVVDVGNRLDELAEEVARLRLGQPFLADNVVEHFAAVAVLHRVASVKDGIIIFWTFNFRCATGGNFCCLNSI